MPLKLELDSHAEEFEYEFFSEEFNQLFAKMFKDGQVGMIAKNHGWRKLDGYRPVEQFSTGMHALNKVNSGETSFKIHSCKNDEYGWHLAINTAHHDSPCWDEWTYFVRPSKFFVST